MRKFVVLRDLQAVQTGEPFGGVLPEATVRGFPSAAPEPRVDVEVLSNRELRDVARDPDVVAVAPVMPTALIHPVATADVEDAAGGSWGVAAVGADASPFTGNGTVVAVLDTGIDRSHPAFTGVDIVEKDFSGAGDGDVQGHGTHCAGTIFGRDVSGGRIGIARGVQRVLIGKVLSDDGSGSSEMLFEGIQWALASGADVISMSLGFDFPGLVASLTGDGWPVELATSTGLEAYRAHLRMFDALMAMTRAREAFSGSAVVTAAAGNESRRDEDPRFEIAASLPAAAEGVVSVGALARDGQALSIAPFSNTFPQISGPGVDIVSAKSGGGVRSLSGTSMACPHVAGVAALWWEAARAGAMPPTARTVLSKLLATARTDVFTSGVEVADRGGGCVTAP